MGAENQEEDEDIGHDDSNQGRRRQSYRNQRREHSGLPPSIHGATLSERGQLDRVHIPLERIYQPLLPRVWSQERGRAWTILLRPLHSERVF